MQLVSEQEGKIRDDIWFPVFPCYLNNDLAFQDHRGHNGSLNCPPGVNKYFCQNPVARGPLQACGKENKPQNPNPEDSHSK